MRPSPTTALLPLLLLAPLASARLTALRLPPTIPPSRTFTATLVNEIYIQSVLDVAVAFGIGPPPVRPDAIGTVLTTQYLGPALSNLRHDLNFSLTVPEGWRGDVVVYAAVWSLYGAGGVPVVSVWDGVVRVEG